MKRTLINPPGTESIYENWQFSQAVKVGDTVWVSGQVGIDHAGKVPSGIEAQTKLAFENLKGVLVAAGATMEDVVELTTFHRDMKEMPGFAKVKATFLPKDYPAWTAIGTTELALPDLRVEVRATAIIGSG
ncbi:MAG: RidA family protein [Candidatus Binatia bacterium]